MKLLNFVLILFLVQTSQASTSCRDLLGGAEISVKKNQPDFRVRDLDLLASQSFISPLSRDLSLKFLSFYKTQKTAVSSFLNLKTSQILKSNLENLEGEIQSNFPKMIEVFASYVGSLKESSKKGVYKKDIKEFKSLLLENLRLSLEVLKNKEGQKQVSFFIHYLTVDIPNLKLKPHQLKEMNQELKALSLKLQKPISSLENFNLLLTSFSKKKKNKCL